MSRGYPLVTSALAADATVIDASWRTYTPQMKITGAGTLPVYATYSGRYMVANNVVRCDILLTGDGGAEGSGTGILSVSLPSLPSGARLAGGFAAGNYVNGTQGSLLFITPVTGDPWAALSGTTNSNVLEDFTGADQNNSTRSVRLHFWYESDLLEPL